MDFYVSRLVFQIQHDAQPEHVQFDESVCLVKAETLDEAIDSAEYLGRLKQMSLNDVRGCSVRWLFIGIAQLERISQPDHGSELFSHIRIEESASDFISYIRTMHQNLRMSQFKEELAL